MSWRIRYTPGTLDGDRFSRITYPMPYRPGYPTREVAETVLASMPHPGRMEVFDEESDT